MPRRVIWSGRRRWMGVPSNKISPSSHLANPVMQLKKVVLPAPLGPIILTMDLSGISKLTALTATRPPKRLVTLFAIRMGAMLASLYHILGGHIFGIRVVQLALGGLRGPEAFRLGKHHDNQGDTIQQEAKLRNLTQKLRQTDQGNGAHDHTGNAAHAADNNEGHDI